jgi:Spy/CpxP family protein refolding chaperone
MKILSSVLTLALALTVCAKAYSAEGEKAPRGKRGPGAMGMMGGGVFLPRNMELTDEQKTKIEAIRKEAREANEKILTDEQKTKMEDLRKSTRAKIMEVLTTEQKEKLEKAEKAMKEGKGKRERKSKEKAA